MILNYYHGRLGPTNLNAIILSATTLLLDLDGVLITTPMWKADEIDTDGYSKFNDGCVRNLNILLEAANFEIVLSSSRRKMKSIDEFNLIFKNRMINQSITAYVPISDGPKNRKEEITSYLVENAIDDFLIIDDDKSLCELLPEYNKKFILTSYMNGLNQDKVNEALKLIK